jgi:hypothetical protein
MKCFASFVLGLLSVVCAGCGGVSTASARSSTSSLVRLLADPARFEGEQVQLVGLLVLEEENHALYLSRGMATDDQFAEAVWIVLDGSIDATALEGANRRMALVEGRFSSTSRGHLGLFAGELVVSRVVIQPSEPRSTDSSSTSEVD